MKNHTATQNSRAKMGLLSMAAGTALVIGGLWIVPAHAEGSSDQGSCNSEQPQQLNDGEGDSQGDNSSDCSSSCDSNGGDDNNSDSVRLNDGEGDNSSDDSSNCDNGDDEETTTTVVDTTVVDTTVVDTTVVDTTVAPTTSVASQGPVPPTSVDQQSEANLPSTGSSSTSLLVALGGLLLGLGLVVAAAGRRGATD